MHVVLLAYYSLAIVVASVVGGLLPDWVRLTHRRTEVVVSFVAGTMLGVALLHMLPHALVTEGGAAEIAGVLQWVLGGFLAMFFIERFFCFHTHGGPDDVPDGGAEAAGHACSDHDHSSVDYAAGLTWSGAAMGLTLHSFLAGVALAASVRHAEEDAVAAGLGAFLAIVLHKPLDAMTIAMLMARGGWSPLARCAVNGVFALAVPLGMVVFFFGVAPLEDAVGGSAMNAALAFSAGVFLCVAMSDLLPELHFHHHDRFALSAALLLGLGLADVARRFESHSHEAGPPTPTRVSDSTGR